MSKVEAPRPRYIAFHLEGTDVGRRRVAEALRALAPWMQLTRYVHPNGIVRVEHTHAAAARKLLGGASIGGGRVEPLRTSGTLAALTGALGVLQQRE